MATHALHPARHHLPETARRAIEETEEADRKLELIHVRHRAQMHFAARWLLAVVFLAMGLDKVVHFRAEADTLFRLDVGGPEMALAIAAVIELAGAVMLWFGWGTRKVAVWLCAYLAALSVGIAAYFPLDAVRLYVLLNASVGVGLLLLASHGAGSFSVDARVEDDHSRM
jgi:putative oxidoreductase